MCACMRLYAQHAKMFVFVLVRTPANALCLFWPKNNECWPFDFSAIDFETRVEKHAHAYTHKARSWLRSNCKNNKEFKKDQKDKQQLIRNGFRAIVRCRKRFNLVKKLLLVENAYYNGKYKTNY